MSTQLLTEENSIRYQLNSRLSTTSTNIPNCRICLDGEQASDRLIRPCECKGTVATIHSACLEKWVETAHNTTCQICKSPYELESYGWKPYYDWSLPQALSNDWEDRLDFHCSMLWMLYFGRFLYIHLKYGTEEVNKQIGELVGNGGLSKIWWFAFWMNLAYYGSITILIFDKWICDNRKYQFKNRPAK